MFLSLPSLRASVAGSALLLAACSDASGPENPGVVIGTDRLHLVVDDRIDLTNTELNIIPGDSIVVRAFVTGNPAAYLAPVITTSDTSAVTVRTDGSVAVRRSVGGLLLSATASPRTTVATPSTLSAWGRLNIMCTAIAVAGISVTLQDSITGLAPPENGGPTVFRAWSATYADSLRFEGPLTPWSTAWERAGVYSVTVDATGYQPWRRDGIEVTRGICHVHPVSLTAKLQRR